MRLLLVRNLWGVVGAWEEVFPLIAKNGYVGIESAVPRAEDRARFSTLLERHGFGYIPQIFTTGKDVQEHIQSFRQQTEDVAKFKPLMINSHSGNDGFREADADRFFTEALRIEQSAGIQVVHETHRGRILYNPWTTQRLVDRFAALKLCADFSHLVCVCEPLLQEDIIRQCAPRCVHVHARVGYEEGPQVSNPRAPEYRPHLEAHEKWWRWIWEAQAAQGAEAVTLTPEFGPPQYLHTLPYTNGPVADLREICDWQARRQATNFAECSRSDRT